MLGKISNGVLIRQKAVTLKNSSRSVLLSMQGGGGGGAGVAAVKWGLALDNPFFLLPRL